MSQPLAANDAAKTRGLSRRQEVAIAMTGIIVSALAGVGGAAIGGRVAQNSTDTVVGNEQMMVLRIERRDAVLRYQSAARTLFRADQYFKDMPDHLVFTPKLEAEYFAALDAVLLYASDAEGAAVARMDGLIWSGIDSKEQAIEMNADFLSANSELTNLLRDDLRFRLG